MNAKKIEICRDRHDWQSQNFVSVLNLFLDKFSSLKIASGIEVAPPITLAYTAFTAYTVAYLPTYNALIIIDSAR